MSEEEIKIEAVDEPNEGIAIEGEISPHEEKARQGGWKPEEEWDGEQDDFITAPEFNRRGELFDKISAQNRKIKDMELTMTDFKGLYNKMEAASMEKAYNQLKQAKAQAMREEEFDAVVEIDEKMGAMKRDVETQQAAQGPSPEFIAWQQENRWYDTNEEMREAADVIGLGVSNKHPDKPLGEVFSDISKQMKRMFPSEFVNPKRTEAAAVGSQEGTRAPASKSNKNPLGRALTAEEKDVGRRFQKQGLMTMDEYIADLAKVE